MNSHQFENAADALFYLKAGKATITIVSKTTGVRYTYRIKEVQYPDNKSFHFVSALCGPDNRTHYTYMGKLSSVGVTKTAKTKLQLTDKRFAAFNWLYRHLLGGILPDKVEIWHEGRCGHCGKKLTVPESIQRGIGPVCFKQLMED